MRLLLFLFLGILSPFLSPGQMMLEGDTVIVSGSQIPLSLRETGRHITVLTSEQIRSLPAVSVDEILQLVPGVEVQSRGGFGVQADILMRGSTFTQVLILVDGMRLNDPLTGHFNGNIPVVNEEIARIEILRGPAAAMYGPDAVGGLINIVTKVFAGKVPEGVSGLAEVGAGSFDQRKLQASLFQGNEKWSGSLGVSYNQSAGELIPEKRTTADVQLEAYRNYFKIGTAGAALRFQWNDRTSLKWRSGYDYRDFNARYFYTTSPLDKSTETTTNLFNVLHVETIRNRSSTDWIFGYKYNTDEFIFSPDFASTNRHKTHFFNFIVNHLWQVNENWTFKTGFQADRRSIRSNDRGDHQDAHTGVYGMAAFQKNTMHITGSLRSDYDENYGLEILPQLNISLNWEAVVLRGSVGRSIRAADYTERYVSNNLPELTPGRSLGNPGLSAESSWSEELGIDFYIGKTFEIKTTGFFRQSDLLIDYVLTNESEIGDIGDLQIGADYFFAKNISSVRTRGIEFESILRQKLSEDGLFAIQLGYTHQRTTNEQGIISVYIANHARDLATWSANLKWKNWNFSLGGLYKNRNARIAQTIDSQLDADYAVWHLRLSKLIWSKFPVTFQLQNLFDTSYQNILGAPMPGRWVSLSAGWKIG